MDTRRWERLAPLTGVLFVLFIVASIITGLIGAPEDFPAPVDDIADYYKDESGMVMVSSWLGGMGSFFLIWFGGSVRARLRDAGEERLGTIAFGGAVTAAAMGLLMNSAHAAAALRAKEDDKIDPATATALYDLASTTLGGGLALGIAVFVAATGIAVLRTRALPSWLGIVSLLLAVPLLIPPIAWAVTALALVWALITSIVLFTSQPAAPVPPPAATTPA